MKKAQTRLCIYPKDVQRITGKTERYSRMLLKKIKKHLNKKDHQVITISEFCSYMGLEKDEVFEIIAG